MKLYALVVHKSVFAHPAGLVCVDKTPDAKEAPPVTDACMELPEKSFPPSENVHSATMDRRGAALAFSSRRERLPAPAAETRNNERMKLPRITLFSWLNSSWKTRKTK